jgi:hypothetical protein
MQIHAPALLLAVLAGCSMPTPPSPRPAPGPLSPQPVPIEASGKIAELIASLGADDFKQRDRATAELSRLGARPEDQPHVVLALRGAATSADAETRSRARSILSTIDRSESMIPSGTMSFDSGQGRLEIALSYFADGSVELTAKVDGAAEELFSGKDMTDLARKVTEAARQRGYAEDQFRMSPEGIFKVGGSTMVLGRKPEEHLIPDFGLWILQIPDTDRTVPERARGSWRIEARTLSGRGYAAGLRVGDILSEVGGTKPATFDELRRLLATATSLKVLRLAVSEMELHY